ncbi:MAG TPA: polysaccharide deacetylase family protein, partial [Tepidisphaeraceae bacterium]
MNQADTFQLPGMKRFYFTTVLAVVALTITSLTLGVPGRDWAVPVVWAAYLVVCGIGMVNIRMQFFGPAICRGVVGRMQVALTFDDGPDPEATPKLLDLLARENISATFFCIGKSVEAHPQIAARIAAEGHLIENHTYSHPWWISCIWGKRLADEMSLAQNAIQKTTGVMPRLMRSPAGLTNPFFPKTLRRFGLTLVGWDVRSFDTMGSAQKAIDRIRRHTRDGSIILLHDGGSSPARIVEIVSAAIEDLRSRGFAFER